jgi:hypothetical protein
LKLGWSLCDITITLGHVLCHSTLCHVAARYCGMAQPQSDPTLRSISKRTTLPKSLRPSSPVLEDVNKYSHIADPKLRTKLVHQATHKELTKALLEDAELLLNNQAGGMEVEGEMERTWKMTQDDIVQAAGQEAARSRRELKLDGGPYRSRFTKNGRQVIGLLSATLLSLISLSVKKLSDFRHLAIVGNSGHVAAFDWQRGTLHTELQLKETCRDITYAFIYFLITPPHRLTGSPFAMAGFCLITHILLSLKRNTCLSTTEMASNYIV